MRSLQGRFLVASPHLPDPNFYRTVTYLCAHNEEGAMGIVINRPLDLNLADEKRRLEEKVKAEAARKEQELKAKLLREEEAAKARLQAREAEAKRKLEAEVQKTLNVQAQDGQSVEDAVEKKLEEKVGAQLRNLFD